MKLTPAQRRCLTWLASNGGEGYLKGSRIVAREGVRSPNSTADPWLHLLMRGLATVEGGGVLRITAYGLAHLEAT